MSEEEKIEKKEYKIFKPLERFFQRYRLAVQNSVEKTLCDFDVSAFCFDMYRACCAVSSICKRSFG